MDAYIYKMNFLVGLSCWIIDEVIILGEPNKAHLTLSSYPKMSDLIDMVEILIRDLPHSEYHPSLHLLWQSRHSLNTDVPSSADLTCFATENILLFPHLKQVYNEFSRASCDFPSYLIKHFILSMAESKNRMFHLFINIFSLDP